MKKTSNAQRRTPQKTGKTFNVQRSTFNAKVGSTREDENQRNNPKDNHRFDLEDRRLEFAVRIVTLVGALPTTRVGNHVAGQLLRCGTSPYAHHGEAQAAESRKDCIHKLGVCFKELKEIKRWLRLIVRLSLIPVEKLRPLLVETDEIIRIFGASIRTAEKNEK